MISLEEARRIVLGDLQPTDADAVSIVEAPLAGLGRTLAAPVVAARTQPPTRTSAMDGYAVRAADLGEARARLKLIGESAAGHAFAGSLLPGQAARISTGATVPDGADQVVMREHAEIEDDDVILDARPTPGSNVRAAGVDFSAGEELLPAGRRLDPVSCALAASAGASALSLRARPRVGVLSTGDELVEPGAPSDDATIINSNAPGVMGRIADAGGEPVYLGIARDTEADVRAGFARAKGLDLLATIGGASVGDHDHLRAVFAADGGALKFEKIAVKPGKPTWYGRLGGLPVLGLAGNPVSAMVLALLLLDPAVRRLCGEAEPATQRVRQVRLAGTLPANGSREAFLRATLDGDRATPLANQDSAALSALARADVLIRREAGAPEAQDGETVEAWAL